MQHFFRGILPITAFSNCRWMTSRIETLFPQNMIMLAWECCFRLGPKSLFFFFDFKRMLRGLCDIAFADRWNDGWNDECAMAWSSTSTLAVSETEQTVLANAATQNEASLPAGPWLLSVRPYRTLMLLASLLIDVPTAPTWSGDAWPVLNELPRSAHVDCQRCGGRDCCCYCMPAGAMVYVELLAWSAVRPLTASWSLWLLCGSLECAWGVSFLYCDERVGGWFTCLVRWVRWWCVGGAS